MGLLLLFVNQFTLSKEQIDKIDNSDWTQTFACLTLISTSFSLRHTCQSGIMSAFFAKFIYNESPSTTPKQVLDMYNRNRFDIISTKDTKNNVMQYVRDIIVKIDVSIIHYVCS